MELLKHFDRNTAGRDLIVGDVHGCFTKLQAALDALKFDPARDRLFSVGDLVDRGQESDDATEWLAKPWFHAVRGNHEQMAIDFAAGLGDPRLYMMNGGAWFIGHPKSHQQWMADQFAALPIAIEVETEHGLVGIVHAECPTIRWQDLRDALTGPASDGFQQLCMWSRDRITGELVDHTEGVSAVIVGHTPVERWTTLGNTIYIDSGAWLPPHRGDRPFTILDAATLRPAQS
jgi:serine/threonine protein phosphatase 1